jgi:hypothetical protein
VLLPTSPNPYVVAWPEKKFETCEGVLAALIQLSLGPMYVRTQRIIELMKIIFKPQRL